MNLALLLSVVVGEILLIEPIFCTSNHLTNNVNQNQTINEPIGLRFQRILRRKRRFLLFPPGAAIVVCISIVLNSEPLP